MTIVKISLLLLVMLVAMNIGASAQVPPPPPPPPIPPPPVPTAPFILTATPTIVISGVPADVTFTVVYNNNPFSGATVTLSGGATGTGITDENGTVTLRVKASGVDEIAATITKDGYSSTEYPAFLTVIHTPPEYIELILRDIVLILAIVLNPLPNQWLAVILIAYFLVGKFFPRINVKFDDYFIIALTPYIIFGSLLSVLNDTTIMEPPIRYLFITPIVYAVTLSITILLLLLTKGIAPKLNIHDWRVLFGGMGVVLSISVFVPLLSVMYRVNQEWVHLEVFLWILGLGAALIFLIYGVSRFTGFSLMTNKLNAIILWAQILNTLSTFIGVNIFRYYAWGSPLMEILGPVWTYLILPILWMLILWIPILWILDTKFRNSDTLRNFLKFVILYIGLAPAVRNILRLVLGV